MAGVSSGPRIRTRQSAETNEEPKFYQIFSHAEFIQERPEQVTPHGVLSVETLKKALHLASGGLKRLPGSGWLLRYFSADHVKLRAPVLSGTGAYVALLYQHTVTILSQTDDYQHPVGVFSAPSQAEEFVHGAWIDEWNTLVVVSSANIIHFLDSKATEISRVVVPDEETQIVGLFIARTPGSRVKRYDVVVMTSDGTLYRYEVHKESVPLLPTHHAADSTWTVRGQHPWGVWSLCFHPEQSALAVIGPGQGCRFSLSFWGLSGSPVSLELLFCSTTPQRFFHWPAWPRPWSSPGNLAVPKVGISPNFQYLAILNPDGSLHLMALMKTEDWVVEDLAIAETSEGESNVSELQNEGKGIDIFHHGVEDFGWWSGNALLVASRRHRILDLLEVPSFRRIWADVPPTSRSCIRLTQVLMGRVFFLEQLAEVARGHQGVSSRFTILYEWLSLTKLRFSEFDSSMGKCGWRLKSLVERSVHEMFLIHVEQGRYDLALKMAEKHGLDTDEVYKAQWKRSDFGKEAVQRLFPSIKDLKWIVNETLDKICLNTEAMSALLEYGLSVTEPFVHGEGQETFGGGSDQVWWFTCKRLRLLQFKDRLETFLAMHSGRFFPDQYSVFRATPLLKVAIKFAEEAKIAPLELLVKRHLYSLAPHILTILNSIPETLPPHSYVNLLPELQAPEAVITRKDADWVERRKTLEAIQRGVGQEELQKTDVGLGEATEHMVILSTGLIWPSELEIIEWYRARARAIDKASGQLENSLTLLNVGLEKGVSELDRLFEDVSDLYWLVFGAGDSDNVDIDLKLRDWEQLKQSEKFEYMLQGANASNVIDKLRERGVPFIRRKYGRSDRKVAIADTSGGDSHGRLSDSLLVEWLRQCAEDNKLEICAAVLAEGCRGAKGDWLFENEAELVTAALECVYACKQTDQWPRIGAILQKLPRNVPKDDHFSVSEEGHPSKGLRGGLASVFRHAGVKRGITMLPLGDTALEDSKEEGKNQVINEVLNERLKQAEAYVEVGKLLSSYQVNVSMTSLLASQDDLNARKQHLRTLLARFTRRQPARSDGDWTGLWHDLRALHEKANFLEKDYLLAEFCRGLLKAGKLSLAKSYLKGNGNAVLPKEQVEKIVLHAAREYFYSASSLDSVEVDIAKQCLALLPESECANVEADLYEAISLRLPNLGVTLLPMEFRQMSNRMEAVRRAISAHPDSYLNVQELIKVTKLLGLTSFEDIAEVEVEIARRALDAGDIELARELCLEVARKGYIPVWEVCAALGRHSQLDLDTRKELLEFALFHCDLVQNEDITSLLSEVKSNIDLQQLEEDTSRSAIPTEQEGPVSPPSHSPPPSGPAVVNGALPELNSEPGETSEGEVKGLVPASGSSSTLAFWRRGREYLSKVTKVTQIGSLYSSEVVARKKIIGFSCLELPWLVEMGLDRGAGDANLEDLGEDKWGEVTRATYMHAKRVSNSDFQQASPRVQISGDSVISPDDKLLLKLAQEALSSPVSRVGDVVACGYLLNLSDPVLVMRIFEQEWENRPDYKDIVQLMNTALLFCQLQDASRMKGEEAAESGLWKDWQRGIEGKRDLLKYAETVKQIVPDAELKRFLAGDKAYIQSTILKMVDSLPDRQLSLLSAVLELAEFYGVSRFLVLQRHVCSLLLSDMVTEEEIRSEVSTLWNELRLNPAEILQSLIADVYPQLDGVKKRRLACFYELVCDFCLEVKSKEELGHPMPGLGWQDTMDFQSEFFRTMADECLAMDAEVEELDFKSLLGIDDLNTTLATSEIWRHVNESNVRRFSDFVKRIHPYVVHKRSSGGGEFPTSESIYLILIKKLLGSVPSDAAENRRRRSISSLDDSYSSCRMYLGYLATDHLRDVLQTLLLESITTSLKDAVEHEHMMARKGASLQEPSLYSVILLWIQAFEDAQMCLSYHENPSNPAFSTSLDEILSCCKSFSMMIVQNRVTLRQGFNALEEYTRMGVFSGGGREGMKFLKSMVVVGCHLQAVLMVVDNMVAKSSSAVRIKQPMISGILSAEQTGEQEDGSQRIDADSEDSRESSSSAACWEASDIVDVYLEIVDSALEGLKQASTNNSLPKLEVLKGVVRSLSVLDDTASHGSVQGTEIAALLGKLRRTVWEQLWRCVKESGTGLDQRIQVFDLLEAVQGKGSHLADDEPPLHWEGWKESSQGIADNMDDVNLSRFLTVMRCTRILFRLWPGIIVTEQDIATADSTISFFCRLEAGAMSANHALALRALLEEWNELFAADQAESSKQQDSGGKKEGWDGWDDEDDWGEGWQEFSHEKDELQQTVGIHKLHPCWKLTLQKLFHYRCEREALQALDSALADPTRVLVSEDEAKELVAKIGDRNAVSALKLALLLPYDFPRSLALQLLAQQLEAGDEDDLDSADGDGASSYESLLALVLSAGLLPAIASNTEMQNIFSSLIVVLRRLGQKAQQQRSQQGRKLRPQSTANEGYVPFHILAYPYSVAELAGAQQFEDAGALVLQYLRVPASRVTKTAAYRELRTYLQAELIFEEKRARPHTEGQPSGENSRTFESYLLNTMRRLDGRLAEVLRRASVMAEKELR